MVKCHDTIATYSTIVKPTDLNSHSTMFGGQIFSLIDTTCAISVSRFCHAKTFTIAINQMEYYQPIKVGEIMNIKSFVCGVGTRSIEVFAYVVGEQLSGEKYLAASCFLTFALDKQESKKLDAIIPTSEFEKIICDSYQERKKLNQNYRQHLQKILTNKDDIFYE